MDLNQYHSYHFIGIGGMGMRALARILINKGFNVSGSDISDSPALSEFKNHGASIYIGHKKENIENADVIIISSAIHSNNPELLEAEARSIPIFHRSDLLAAIFKWGKGIAVAGAHGKSTTSSMIGQIFYSARMSPTIVLGAATDYLKGNSCLGHGDYVIAEADESDGSFLKFHPFLAVVTNIEDDHLDHYGTIENIQNAFADFVNNVSYNDGAALLCTDSEGVKTILPKVKSKIITFGMNEDAEYRAVNKRYEDNYMRFDVWHKTELLGTISLQTPGTHNVKDALGAVAVGLYCGIPFSNIKSALQEFTGVKRRFQTKMRNRDIWIVDDYAHHPTEIEATLAAAKESGNHRVICVFQPHRYSRTNLLKDEFAVAFNDADVLFFTDIYASNEEPIKGVNGKLIPDLVKKQQPNKEIYYIEKTDKLLQTLYSFIKRGDMVITMGAGNIYQVGEKLSEYIKEKGLRND